MSVSLRSLVILSSCSDGTLLRHHVQCNVQSHPIVPITIQEVPGQLEEELPAQGLVPLDVCHQPHHGLKQVVQ